jgi:hypothetical protein
MYLTLYLGPTVCITYLASNLCPFVSLASPVLHTAKKYIYTGSERCLTPTQEFSAISWREEVTCQ